MSRVPCCSLLSHKHESTTLTFIVRSREQFIELDVDFDSHFRRRKNFSLISKNRNQILVSFTIIEFSRRIRRTDKKTREDDRSLVRTNDRFNIFLATNTTVLVSTTVVVFLFDKRIVSRKTRARLSLRELCNGYRTFSRNRVSL